MSLKKITSQDAASLSQDPNQLLVAIDNGDLKALKSVVEGWGFINDESALRFALAILAIAKDEKKIHVTQEGKDTIFVPADYLLKPKTPPATPNINPSTGAG